MDSKACGKFDDVELRVMSDAIMATRWTDMEEAKEKVAKLEKRIEGPDEFDVSKIALGTMIIDIKKKIKKSDALLSDINDSLLGCIYKDQFRSESKEYPIE